MAESRFLEVLREKVVVFDGSMGVTLMAMNLTKEDFRGKEGCYDYLVHTRPDVIGEVHRTFLRAGADVVETDTFCGTRIKLDEYGLGGLAGTLSRDAALLARRVCEEFATPERPRFVAGSIGPTGFMPSTNDPALGQITFDELERNFSEQARGLIEGSADVLIIETMIDALEAKAAVAGARRAMRELSRRVPIMVQASLDLTGRMLLGNDIASWYWTLEGLGVDVIGMNCGVGPDYMRDAVRHLCQNGHHPVSCIPNAGLPINEGGRTVYPMKPRVMADLLGEFVAEYGLNIVGGCCGTTPDHIALIAEAARRAPAPGLRRCERPDTPRRIFAASPMKAVALKQDGTITIIGERLNTQGSRKVKELLLADDYEGLVPIARSQVEGGAHLLDVCTALTERPDEAEQMRRAVKLLAQSVDAPLVIDTTEPSVLEAALKQYPGSAVVNSINLENGRDRIDRVVPLVAEHGASVIALTIDKAEGGMAKTAEAKLRIARKIHGIVVGEYGIEPGRVLFDALTFTLATGEREFRRSAIETIEGIRSIKRGLPGVLTTLGVSNVSFGLPKNARPVLNSVFLHHCMEAGLDTAIINATHVMPYFEIGEAERSLCDDLIFDRREDALARVIAHFEGTSGSTLAAVREDAVDFGDADSLARAIHYKILHRRPTDVDRCVENLIVRHGRPAVDVLNNVLLPAMKEVGDKFGAGELILPFVLQSAEVMKKAVATLERHLEKVDGATKGRLVLATVFGDVHDIGKNLVHTILSNNGYTVYDLGKQVPVQTIIEKAKEVGADAIGLSALLVSTSKQMPTCVRELAHQGLGFPVIIGGAAINRSFGRRAMFLSDDTSDTTSVYAPGVFYAKDAFEGLHVMDALGGPDRAAFVERVREEAVRQRVLEREAEAIKSAQGSNGAARPRSSVRRDVRVPEPPFLGWRVFDGVPLDEMWKHLDLNELYRVGWGAKGQSGPEFERTVRESFEPKLAELQREARRHKWLAPRIIHGFYPAFAEGDALVILDPADGRGELARFDFPRQQREGHLCLSDYVRPAGPGGTDFVALQVVTLGPRATELYDEWHAKGDVTRAYFLHGFATESAEALASWSHQRIRSMWGLGESEGKRYSFGYSACPNLADHEIVWRLMPVERELGVRLTASHQLVPEQSTVAIVLHHPECVYFVV